MAVSGGADSVALLHGLVALRDADGTGWKLHVAHLNHGLRGDASDADADFVRAQAALLDLPCTVGAENVAALTGSGRGIEEAARDCRYAFLLRVAEQTNSSVVALAHHADDNVETILHRILRGTGLRGLGGIPVQRRLASESEVRLIRPLLRLRRDQLRAFLAERDLPWRQDESNADLRMMRNRLRAAVLPLLREQVNPAVDEALLRLAEQAQQADALLREQADAVAARAVRVESEGQLLIRIEDLRPQPRIVQQELVRCAIVSLGLGEKSLTAGHLAAVVRLAAEPGRGKRIDLPGGLVVSKEPQSLRFRLHPQAEPRPDLPEVTIPLDGETPLPDYGITIHTAQATFRPEKAGDLAGWKRRKAAGHEWLDRDRLHPPLTVRTHRPGERFHPLGAPGTKTLADFLGEAKVAPAARKRTPIVYDQRGPIWVIPYRIDERVKLTPATRRVFRLSAAALATGAG